MKNGFRNIGLILIGAFAGVLVSLNFEAIAERGPLVLVLEDLHWADPAASTRIKWQESLLLNIRGLTEIVFLNLLLQLQLIDALVYFSLLLMSLFSTLLPALLGKRPSATANNEARSRYEIP